MQRRGSLTLGVMLILVGGFFLAVQFVPQLDNWWRAFADWPFWIIGPGVLFLMAALVSGEYGLVVPGTIISGVGALLYYQNATGDWQSWSYAWTLVIGFVGVGVSLMHLLEGNIRKALDEGVTAIITSMVMFLIFGSFMRYILGQEPFFGRYWPVLIIFWGLWLLMRPLVRGRKAVEAAQELEPADEASPLPVEEVEVPEEEESI